MRICCDKNMPLGRTLFGTLGPVTLVNGVRLRKEDLAETDMLIVRDTKVNEDLLGGTPVRFVGAAISGTDNLDKAWLAKAGIRWVHAPRANGESVADYCIAALLEYAHMRGVTLAGKTVALIGVGWIGSMIRSRCEAMAMRVLCCDPPRRDNVHDHDAQGFRPMQEVLAEADFIVPFVPLTADGPYPTFHMIDAAALEGTRYGAVLVNMARGAVCDTPAVIAALRSGRLSDAIIDVWEDEPLYNAELADLVFLATPHLAGHSYEGKVNGTVSVYNAACNYFGKRPALTPMLPPPVYPHIEIDAHGKSDEEVLWFLTQKISMIVADHLRFQDTFHLEPAARVQAFNALRRTYPYRRQFCATEVGVQHGTPALKAKIAGIGFKLREEG